MNIGFKEWTLVCQALGSGQQSIILRKGGIAEGRDGFRFKHDEFFLFPTLFHEQLSKTKLPEGTPLPTPEPDSVCIQYSARVEWTELITDLDIIATLAPFHIWKDEVIEERFRYDDVQGVNLAFVRIFRLEPDWTFPDEPKFGGCRSWLNLPELPAGTKLVPVLDDATHAEREAAVRNTLQKQP
ncbi:MAG: DUF1802 family protein [Chthoniobacteraceae bacterium]